MTQMSVSDLPLEQIKCLLLLMAPRTRVTAACFGLLQTRAVVTLHQLCSSDFKDANAKQRRSGKPDRCLEILKLLETYSQELLKMAAKISQGEDVIQFFKAQTQDLDPSFPENRYGIIFVVSS